VRNLVLILACCFLAIPAGSTVGLIVAALLTFGEIGQLPMLTVPAGIVAALVFALWRPIEPLQRLKILGIGSVVGVVIAILIN
jgi:hypothetical protein